MLCFTHPVDQVLTQNYKCPCPMNHDRISSSVFNDYGVKIVDTVTGDMICPRYSAFVKVQLKPRRCVCKHFEQFSFSLLTYVFSLFMSVIV